MLFMNMYYDISNDPTYAKKRDKKDFFRYVAVMANHPE